ncbi:MAG: hypothetical protein KC933_18910 [Myxococcales bacterium]|nr:hypothetical protein [Myxococcales bacterium]MCB9645537.1 hypothetical protein [Deltaproteobacteria bacterium]
MSTCLRLELPDAEAWAAHQAGLQAHGGLMVPGGGAANVALFEPVEVEVAHAGRVHARAEGRVVQLSAAGEAAVLFEGAAKEALLALTLSDPTAATADAPLWARYETLSRAEKLKLARNGNPDARRRVLRDPDQAIHPFLLTNPGLTAQEVVGWLRSGLVPGALTEQIAKRPELIGNQGVVDALVQDPKTPMPVALRLLPKVSMETCRRIAKAGKLRQQIVSAARKRVISP